MNLANCAALPRRPLTATWYRAVEPQYLPIVFNTAYTKLSSSRFGPGHRATTPFELFYLAEDQQVALFEVEALFGNPLSGHIVPNPSRPWLALNVSVQLQMVADLTDVINQRLLETTAQELTGDWRGYQRRGLPGTIPQPVGKAPTQELGEVLFAFPNLEAFQTVSARVPIRRTVVVFPKKLRKGSHLRFTNPGTGGIIERVGF